MIMAISGGIRDGADGIGGTAGDGILMGLVDSMIFTGILSILGFMVAFMEVFMIHSTALLFTGITHHIEGQDILTMDTLDMEEGEIT